MIKGAKYWNAKNDDPPNDYFSIQSNNAARQLLNKAYDMALKDKGILTQEEKDRILWEWCGNETFTNIIGVMLGWRAIKNVGMIGSARIQLGDHLAMWQNTPGNYNKFREVLKIDYEHDWANRYIVLFQLAAFEYFDILTEKKRAPATWEMKNHVMAGGAIQTCLLTPPHYRSIKAYDAKKGVFICDDPAPELMPDGKGYSIEMTDSEIVGNTVDVKLFYHPPEGLRK